MPSAIFMCSSLACFPPHIAVTEALTFAFMLGMMRTTGVPLGRRSAYQSVVLPAAMVSTSFSFVMSFPISSRSPCIICGLTARTMTSAFSTTSAAEPQGMRPCFSFRARVFASLRL